MIIHQPVLLKEALEYLNPRSGKHYIDATADGGGHAIAILKAILPDGRLLALEWDEDLFGQLQRRFKKECLPFSKNYVLRQSSYTALADIVGWLNFGPVAGVLFDLGLSSFHFEESKRGFSFQRDEALDMRYSRSLRQTAADILRSSNREELERILKSFGQERFARQIAQAIVAARRYRPIGRTSELVAVIREAMPQSFHHQRIHFATRTFQALRIAVNHELENIEKGLAASTAVLEPGGRIVLITFHSLEETVVKNFFRQEKFRNAFISILKRPLRPKQNEIKENPRARSARLHAFERVLL